MSKVYVLKSISNDIWRIQWKALGIICMHSNKTYMKTEMI